MVRPVPAALGAGAVIIAIAGFSVALGVAVRPDGGAATPTPAPIATPSPTPTPTPTPAPTPTPSPTPTPAGGPGMTVGVVGDSVMISALPGLQAEADRRGWLFVNGAHRACPVGYEPLFLLDGTPAPGQCDGIKSLHFQLMVARPDVIVWLDINSRWARKDSAGTLLQPGTQAWKDELYPEWTMVLDRFLAAGARVVVVMPPLRSQQAAGCKGVTSAARCREVQSQDAVIREATPEWFASVADRQGIYMIEVDSLLCPNGYPCPTRISGITVRETGYDQTHFTAAGAAWFAPHLFDRVLAALNVEPPPGQTG